MLFRKVLLAEVTEVIHHALVLRNRHPRRAGLGAKLRADIAEMLALAPVLSAAAALLGCIMCRRWCIGMLVLPLDEVAALVLLLKGVQT